MALNLVWYVMLPVWLLAGVGDYLCHRRSDIGHTSGFRESLLHALQAFQLGVPLLAALFLEINGIVVLVMAVFVIAHTITAVWDVSYTAPKRHVAPIEQHIHSYLEILPMVAVALAAVVHWDDLSAFTLQLKTNPVPASSIALVLGAVAVLNLLPLIEELVRTYRQTTRPA